MLGERVFFLSLIGKKKKKSKPANGMSVSPEHRKILRRQTKTRRSSEGSAGRGGGSASRQPRRHVMVDGEMRLHNSVLRPHMD